MVNFKEHNDTICLAGDSAAGDVTLKDEVTKFLIGDMSSGGGVGEMPL